MVMSLAFHPDDPGSIPGRNSFNFFLQLEIDFWYTKTMQSPKEWYAS